MPDRVQLITDLCQAWVDEIVRPDGSIVVRLDAKDNPLTRNGLFPHLMTHAELRAATLGLINILSIPNYQVIGPDGQLLWGWCAEIFDTGYGYFQPRSPADMELRGLFMATAHAFLADPQIVLAYERDPSTLQALPTSARQALALIEDHSTVSAYLCFPLLEGVLRKTLGDFVARDGRVLKPFSIAGRHYGKPKGRLQCNSLAHMLHLLESDQQKKGSTLADDLSIASKHLRRSQPATGTHPYDMIGFWRNSSLHGNLSLVTMGARLFHLVNLIALHNLIDLKLQPADYDQLADMARKRIASPARAVRWSYYPSGIVRA